MAVLGASLVGQGRGAMLDEDALIEYIFWSGYGLQSVDAMRPQVPRGVSWLRAMGVTRSPLHGTSNLSHYEAARSHNLINLWLLQARPTRDTAAEHEMRNLLVGLGTGVRPYKP